MDITRRQFIIRAGALLGAGAVVYYLPHVLTIQRTADKDELYQSFIKISELLTDNHHLSPELMSLYFTTLYQQKNNAAFLELLTKNRHPEDISLELRHNGDLGQEIKKIIHLWYFGTFENRTISAQAYQQSLVWNTFGATPPGISSGTHWDRIPNGKL